MMTTKKSAFELGKPVTDEGITALTVHRHLPPVPSNEPARQAALQILEILDSPPEIAFDRITSLTARAFDVPICLIRFVPHGVHLCISLK